MAVLLMSLPMADAIREKSLLLACLGALWLMRLWLAWEDFVVRTDLERMESTQARNSFVRSWIGIVLECHGWSFIVTFLA